MRLEGDARAEWRRHWPVVLAAGLGVAGTSMHNYSMGIFIEPLQREFGWSRTQITSGPALASIVCIAFTPFMGAVLDRFGPRRIAIPGLIVAFLLTAMLALAGPSYASWMGIWLLLAFVAPLVLPNVWATAVSGLFRAGRGLALGLTLAGSGLSSIITPIVTFWLIDQFGWRMGFVGMALFWGVLSVPLAITALRSVRDDERKAGKVPVTRMHNPTPLWRRSGLTSFRFLRLALAGFVFAAMVPPLVISIFPVLTWSGLSREAAAQTASLVGIAAIVGRISIGYLLDRIEGRYLAVAVTALPLTAALLLLGGEGAAQVATLAAICLGLALGAEYDIVAYMASRYFPIEHFGLLFGTLAGIIAFAGAGGPLWINATYDATGSYRLALQLMLPFCPLAALLFVSLGRYPAQPAGAMQQSAAASG